MRPLIRSFLRQALVVLAAAAAAGCATRPVSTPLEHADTTPMSLTGSRYESPDNAGTLVILAFSGGGTRAAAFAYGVLETLRDMEVTTKTGRKERVLDAVDVITGISGGSFPALAYGLQGDGIFDTFETAFLKRDVQGALIARALNPANWPALASPGWGRSELAADYYDEILFKGATYRDLRRDGPRVHIGATNLSDGTHVQFNRETFDILCSDLSTMRVARAAAASSAVPGVLSSITIDNYGGTCGYEIPQWAKVFLDGRTPPRPAARTIKRLTELQAFANRSERPFLHLVDGGVSDNLGMRGVLDVMSTFESLHLIGVPTPYDHVRNIYVFVVNSLASPPNHWDQREAPPGILDILLKSAGTSIDRYSYDTVETLKDTQARWALLRKIRTAIQPYPELEQELRVVMHAPDAVIRVVDVSFDAIPDAAERAFLNTVPTSFTLPEETVDRLRLGAKAAILASPEIERLMEKGDLRMIGPGPRVDSNAAASAM